MRRCVSMKIEQKNMRLNKKNSIRSHWMRGAMLKGHKKRGIPKNFHSNRNVAVFILFQTIHSNLQDFFFAIWIYLFIHLIMHIQHLFSGNFLSMFVYVNKCIIVEILMRLLRFFLLVRAFFLFRKCHVNVITEFVLYSVEL